MVENKSARIFGKFFPAKGYAGTPCYKEAQQKGRVRPLYGTMLFGVYLIDHPRTGACYIDSSPIQGCDQQRLVIELSLKFDTSHIEVMGDDWDSLAAYADPSWVKQAQLKQFYQLTLPEDSFFLKENRSDAGPEGTLRRFTRRSRIGQGGQAVSFVAKANCQDVDQLVPVNHRIHFDGKISAYEARLKILDMTPPSGSVVSMSDFVSRVDQAA